jgi:hypothetical protein
VIGTFARLVLSGRREYRQWMVEAARRLVDDAADLELPESLINLLID